MVLRFHAQAGNCGYTLLSSMKQLELALKDPYQTVMGIRASDPCTGVESWVGYCWVQLQDNFGYVVQVWSAVPGGGRMIAEYVDGWCRERGAFIVRAGVSRKWLRALEKRYGFTATQTVVEKRLIE